MTFNLAVSGQTVCGLFHVQIRSAIPLFCSRSAFEPRPFRPQRWRFLNATAQNRDPRQSMVASSVHPTLRDTSMSISSMTNVAVMRRADVPPLDVAPKSDAAIAQATSGTDASRASGSQVQVIATYIPTEVLALYVAMIAALHDPSNQGQSTKSQLTAWITGSVMRVKSTQR